MKLFTAVEFKLLQYRYYRRNSRGQADYLGSALEACYQMLVLCLQFLDHTEDTIADYFCPEIWILRSENHFSYFVPWKALE